MKYFSTHMLLLGLLVQVVVDEAGACRWSVRFVTDAHRGGPASPLYMMDSAPNSLSKQSRYSPDRPHTPNTDQQCFFDAGVRHDAIINLDGYGLGWFEGDKAQVRKSPKPIEAIRPAEKPKDNPLAAMMQDVRSNVLFGHIRQAGSSVTMKNTHPFVFKKGTSMFLFQHNGDLTNWRSIREELSDEELAQVHGTGDSEIAGALFLHYLPDNPKGDEGRYSATQVEAALKRAILELAHPYHTKEPRNKEAMYQMVQKTKREIAKLKAAGKDKEAAELEIAVFRQECHSSASMNFAVSDGHTLVATRFASCPHYEPPSLYFNNGTLQPGVLLVSSEPLNKAEGWQLLKKDEMIVATQDGMVRTECLSQVCEQVKQQGCPQIDSSWCQDNYCPEYCKSDYCPHREPHNRFFQEFKHEPQLNKAKRPLHHSASPVRVDKSVNVPLMAADVPLMAAAADVHVTRLTPDSINPEA